MMNIGNEKISFHDDVFAFPEIMNGRYVHPEGNLIIDVLDSAGKHPLWNLPRSKPNTNGYDPAFDPEQVPILAVERKKYPSKVAAWKKQGLSDVDIDTRLAKDWRKRKETGQGKYQATEHWLEPGASTATVSHASQVYRIAGTKSDEVRSSEFAELSALYLPPGKYKVRAIWNAYFKPADVKKYHLKPHPWNVLIETPPIELEISN